MIRGSSSLSSADMLARNFIQLVSQSKQQTNSKQFLSATLKKTRNAGDVGAWYCCFGKAIAHLNFSASFYFFFVCFVIYFVVCLYYKLNSTFIATAKYQRIHTFIRTHRETQRQTTQKFTLSIINIFCTKQTLGKFYIFFSTTINIKQ